MQSICTVGPSSPPFRFTSLSQNSWASRAVLPFDASGPVSDRQYPILRGRSVMNPSSSVGRIDGLYMLEGRLEIQKHAELLETPQRSLGKLVEKHIDGGYFAVAGDKEIGSCVLGRLAWRAGHPADPPRIADLLGRRDRLISKVGMSGLDLAGDAVDFVAAAMSAAVRVVKHPVFG